MEMIINGEPYHQDIPEFTSARWKPLRDGTYNLELLYNDEIVLTFHFIEEEDRQNYQLADGEINEPASDPMEELLFRVASMEIAQGITEFAERSLDRLTEAHQAEINEMLEAADLSRVPKP
jgi:hypothetical protein